MIRPAILFVLLLPLALAGPARAQDAFLGEWRADEGPDVAAQLVLTRDGRFDYALAAGALDEQAAGIWERMDGRACLTTQPKPVPPEWLRAAPAADGPTVMVTWPGGEGIAGIDLRVGFDSGPPIESYTQYYGWTLPTDEARVPRWIELADPVHGIAGPRFPLADGDHRRLKVTLVPHDLGVVDFQRACIDVTGDRAVLHRREGDFRFVRARRP
ncbi:MAG: hypothetical protein RIS94_2381 [Pseudomonadota bacterium]|jgi:hypothetical protein